MRLPLEVLPGCLEGRRNESLPKEEAKEVSCEVHCRVVNEMSLCTASIAHVTILTSVALGRL